jgi:arabinose-5-phosphate isomerase
MVLKDDIVIAISKSGETQEILNLLPTLRALDVPIIVMTGKMESNLARYATVVLDISVEKEACPYDLAPTASTTVTLVLGDALAITLLEAKGFSIDEYAMLHPGGALGNQMLLRVEDIMESGEKLPFCMVGAKMKLAIVEMSRKRGICPVITKDRKVAGVITVGDLNRLIEKDENFAVRSVTDVMTKNPKMIYKDELAAVAYKILEKNKILAMPVLDRSDTLVGVVHLHDLMHKGIQ